MTVELTLHFSKFFLKSITGLDVGDHINNQNMKTTTIYCFTRPDLTVVMILW